MTIGIRSSAVLVFFCAVVLSLPLFVHAGMQADAMCNPVIPACPCNKVPGPNGKCIGGVNWFMCPGYCKDTEPGGVTTGHCVAPNLCHGDSTSGGAGQAGGGLDAGLSQLGQMLGQLMGALKGGGGGGGGGGDSQPQTPATTGCTTAYYQTSDPSKLTDPCAQYVPANPVTYPTSTTTVCDSLSQALGACNPGTPVACPPVAVDCGSGYVQAPQTGVDANNCPLPNQCVLPDTTTQGNSNGVSRVLCSASARLIGLCSGSSNPNLSGLGTSTGLQGGTTGNIFLQNNGATVVANSVNPAGNTIVAGFYGSNTLGGGQPQGIAASMCQNRPWKAGVLGGIIPASFFDGLCSWQGYQVGTSTPQTTPVVEVHQTTPTPTVPRPTTTATTTAATSSVPAKVQIWAVPASVPLNTRTSVFWSAQGVTSCTETSPDGSFNQSSLSGGAATVPLESATTFTISCLDLAGNPVTGFVTVNLSI